MGAIGIMLGGLIGRVATTVSSRESIHEAIKQEIRSKHELSKEKADKITSLGTSYLWSSILCYRTIPWAIGLDILFIVAIISVITSPSFIFNVPFVVLVIIVITDIPLLIKGIGYYQKKADNYLKQNAHISVDDVLNRIQKTAEELVKAEAAAQEKEQSIIEQAKIEKTRKKLKHQCSDCGVTTKYGANYCSGCGKKIDWERLLSAKMTKQAKQEFCCDKCNTKLKYGMKYCPNCGKELDWPDGGSII